MISKLSAWYREKVSKEQDCWACRIVSGVGMLGIGAFLLSHSKRPKMIENYTMKGLAAVAGFLGLARMADAEFLKAETTTSNKR